MASNAPDSGASGVPTSPMLLGHAGLWLSWAGFAPCLFLAWLFSAGILRHLLSLVLLASSGWLIYNVVFLPDWTLRTTCSRRLRLAGMVARGVVGLLAAGFIVLVLLVAFRALKWGYWGAGAAAAPPNAQTILCLLVLLSLVAVYGWWLWRAFLRRPDWATAGPVPVGVTLIGHFCRVTSAIAAVYYTVLAAALVCWSAKPGTWVCLVPVVGAFYSIALVEAGSALTELRAWARLGVLLLLGIALALGIGTLVGILVSGTLFRMRLSFGVGVSNIVSLALLLGEFVWFAVYLNRAKVVKALRSQREAQRGTPRVHSGVKALGDVCLWLSGLGVAFCVATVVLGLPSMAPGPQDTGRLVLFALLFAPVAALGAALFRNFLRLKDWAVAPEVPLGVKLLGHLGRIVGSLAMAACVALCVLTIVCPGSVPPLPVKPVAEAASEAAKQVRADTPRPLLAAIYLLGIFISMVVRTLGSAISDLRTWARPGALIVTGLAVALLTVALIFNLTEWKVDEARLALPLFLGFSAVLFLFLLVYLTLPPVVEAFERRRL